MASFFRQSGSVSLIDSSIGLGAFVGNVTRFQRIELRFSQNALPLGLGEAIARGKADAGAGADIVSSKRRRVRRNSGVFWKRAD